MTSSVVERVVARILLRGGLLSVGLMLVGLAVYFGQGHPHMDELVQGVHSREAGRAVDVSVSLADVGGALRRWPPDALAITLLGLLCLLATPVVGVAAATLCFWLERDRRYALISAIVFTMLLASLLLGGI